MSVIGMILLEPTSQSAGGETDPGCDGQERHRTTTREALHLVQNLPGVMILEPAGGGLGAGVQLVHEVFRNPGLRLLAASDAGDVVAEGAHGACSTIQLFGGLGLQHRAGLATEAFGLAYRVILDPCGFLRGGVLDGTSGLRGVAGDISGRTFCVIGASCRTGLGRMRVGVAGFTGHRLEARWGRAHCRHWLGHTRGGRSGPES